MTAAIGAILLIVTAQAPPDAVRMLDEAIAAYSEALDTAEPDLRLERFRRATRLFRQVIDEQGIVNAYLYANLGSAAMQSEQLGEAILAYRRAVAIDSGHRRAEQNLIHARSQLPTWVPRPQSSDLLDTFFAFHRRLTRSTRALAAAVCFALTMVLMAVAIRFRRPWARFTALAPGALWIALLVLVARDVLAGSSADAVVTVPQAVVRAADSAGAASRFADPFPAGAEVRIVEQRGDWARIELANGRDGWVRQSSITPVAPGAPGAALSEP